MLLLRSASHSLIIFSEARSLNNDKKEKWERRTFQLTDDTKTINRKLDWASCFADEFVNRSILALNKYAKNVKKKIHYNIVELKGDKLIGTNPR